MTSWLMAAQSYCNRTNRKYQMAESVLKFTHSLPLSFWEIYQKSVYSIK